MTSRLRIGLTGGIASGKSTVAQRFAELGVPVIDADESARIVVAPGSPGLAEVVGKFGENLLTPDGELDRRPLRKLIFSDPGRRHELEAILHPLIRADMEHRASVASGPYLVMAIPLLIENGGRGREQVDRVLVVDVDEQVQLKRIVERDGGTMEQAKAILAAQATRTARLQAADDVLPNAGSLSELRHGVDQLHQRYVDLARRRNGHVGRST
jgi:dephospho-CoA kinase